MLKLYGTSKSRSARSLWALEELGLKYEHIPVEVAKAKSPEHLKLNPNGHIPVLEDDGNIFWESMAINLYLAKKAGKLYPTDAKAEALTWQWCFWEVDRLDRQLTTYANNAFVLPEAQRNAALAKSTWEEIAAALDVLESALGKGEWLAGSAFSVADLNVASAMVRVVATPPIDSAVAKWAKVHAWLHRCWDRPAARRALAMRD